MMIINGLVGDACMSKTIEMFFLQLSKRQQACVALFPLNCEELREETPEGLSTLPATQCQLTGRKFFFPNAGHLGMT